MTDERAAKILMKPVLKYPGSKWRLADWIVSIMPPHKSYLEPFFGSGAVTQWMWPKYCPYCGANLEGKAHGEE